MEKHTTIARWGGDEFIGFMESSHAAKQLERLRTTLAGTENSLYGHVTLSIGLTELDKTLRFEEVCERADQALYISKTNGRNQLTIR